MCIERFWTYLCRRIRVHKFVYVALLVYKQVLSIRWTIILEHISLKFRQYFWVYYNIKMSLFVIIVSINS